MVKMKIGEKLLLTYVILLLAVLMVTGITFRVLMQRYLVNEAKSALKTEAKAIANTLAKVPIFEGDLRPNILAKRQMRIHGQFIESKVIVVNNANRIIYSNLEEADRKAIKIIAGSGRLKARGYVSEQVPVFSPNGEVKGRVLLFTRIDELKKISSVMNRTQFLSLVTGGAVAIILGMFFQRSLSKPIKKLKSHISGFSLRSSQPELKIQTGDEIQELAECFEDMARKLKAYDIQQKRFLQNSSHELKTPLMSIQGYAEAIKDGVVAGDEVQEGLEVIIDESRRLKKIVDELIYLAKLDNVEETFHFENTAFKEIIDNSVKSIKTLADAKALKLEVKGDPSCTGLFDREKLTGAIINLLSNGVRYAETEILISWELNDNNLHVEIEDDGPGFKAGEEERVFERFYKGEKGGTGIGLAIAKAVIEGHKGRIEAFNSLTGGAVFSIKLPVHER